MGFYIDLTGKRFSHLTVLSLAEKRGRFHFWRCRCDCGGEKIINGQSLRNKRTASCGCIRKAQLSARSTKHGHNRPGARTRVYGIWVAMRQRCLYEKDAEYPNYGGRGIKVCDRWLGPDGFANFLADVGEPPTTRHSIDRFPDGNGNYEPGNCRWATAREQARNMSRNRLITVDGQTRCVTEWEEMRGLCRGVISSRLARGWDERKAIMTPTRSRH